MFLFLEGLEFFSKQKSEKRIEFIIRSMKSAGINDCLVTCVFLELQEKWQLIKIIKESEIFLHYILLCYIGLRMKRLSTVI